MEDLLGSLLLTTVNQNGQKISQRDVEKLDHENLRHLSTEYRSILSTDMSTDSRPISRLILDRYLLIGTDGIDQSMITEKPFIDSYRLTSRTRL